MPVTPSWIIPLSLLAFWAEADATVRPIDGEAIRGALTELSPASVVVKTADGAVELATSNLLWVEFPTASAPAKPTTWIELRDGSRLAAVEYTAKAGSAHIEMPTGSAVDIPTRAIHAVRFRPPLAELAAQWREIAMSKTAGDIVVVRKTSMRTVEQGDNEPMTVTEQALDQLEGTIHEVTPSTVQFELDSEKIDVRREKLEGIVYYSQSNGPPAAPLARLLDSGGSVWAVRDVKLVNSQIQATTVGNVTITLPLSAIVKVDFSVGNVAFLWDLEADSGSGDAGVSLQPAGMSYKFGRIFQLRPRPPLGTDAFRIASGRYDSGLSLHSPARLVYRVPEGFARFRAIAGVDDSVVAPGRFDLIIQGDGKELFRHSFSSDQRREPVPIDLQIKGVRRLMIVLDPVDGQDIGDQLDLCEARFTK